MDQHRNVGCHCLHGTHGSTARCSPPAPCPGRRARTYLVPQARVCSCFEEQCHCPRVATQDGCVESRGPVLENTGGDVGTMHGKKPKGSETQMFAKNKPMNKKEVTRKRLGHQRYRVWFRQGAGRLVGAGMGVGMGAGMEEEMGAGMSKGGSGDGSRDGCQGCRSMSPCPPSRIHGQCCTLRLCAHLSQVTR